MKVDCSILDAKDKKIFVKDNPDQSISMSKVVRMALSRGEAISGEGSYWPKVDSKREWVENPFDSYPRPFPLERLSLKLWWTPRSVKESS